jgi:hypothetical protein
MVEVLVGCHASRLREHAYASVRHGTHLSKFSDSNGLRFHRKLFDSSFDVVHEIRGSNTVCQSVVEAQSPLNHGLKSE